MTSSHCIRAAATIAVLAAAVAAPRAQVQAPAPPSGDPAASSYIVFLSSRPIGREEVAVTRQADGWIVRGTSRVGRPVDIETRHAEIRYDSDWHPRALTVEGTVRGTQTNLKTTFADGKANTETTVGGTPSTRMDEVAPDTIVLPNAFLGSYAALTRRLVGASVGTTFHAYIAPQGEITLRVDALNQERIDTPKQQIAATHARLRVTSPNPAGELQISLWLDRDGGFLRLSVPAQMLEVAREDISSAAARTTSFSLPGDETVHIPAAGFTLAGTITKPQGVSGPLPALVLIGGSSPTDRDGFVAGIPVLGQMARDLVEAGFLVVRYDKRGIGQSGGRTETATLADYADDVRSIVRWLRDRDDVDDRRVGLVGHAEGAWVAMLVASREDDVKAIALVAAPSTTGAELVLEQQRQALARLEVPAADAEEKIALQQKINEAVLSGKGWDELPANVRAQADTPFFQSFLTFDPAKVMKDIDQPVLIVQGALDTEVRPEHADRLAELARARKRKVSTDLVVVPGVNHLLVPAKTGAVDEYRELSKESVSSTATTAIGTWMARELGPGRK